MAESAIEDAAGKRLGRTGHGGCVSRWSPPIAPAGPRASCRQRCGSAGRRGTTADSGTGFGHRRGRRSAGLALAALRPELSLGLVENDPLLIALAQDNLVANHFAARGAILASMCSMQPHGTPPVSPMPRQRSS